MAATREQKQALAELRELIAFEKASDYSKSDELKFDDWVSKLYPKTGLFPDGPQMTTGANEYFFHFDMGRLAPDGRAWMLECVEVWVDALEQRLVA